MSIRGSSLRAGFPDILKRGMLALAATMSATGTIAYLTSAARSSDGTQTARFSLGLVFLLICCGVVWQLLTRGVGLDGIRLSVIVGGALVAVGLHRGLRLEDVVVPVVLAASVAAHPRRREIFRLTWIVRPPLLLVGAIGAVAFLVLGLILLSDVGAGSSVAISNEYAVATLALSLSASAVVTTAWPTPVGLRVVGVTTVVAAVGWLAVGSHVVPTPLEIFAFLWGGAAAAMPPGGRTPQATKTEADPSQPSIARRP